MPALVDGELDPCLPLCRIGVTHPGAVTLDERYQTRWFAGGYMTVTFHEPWTILEDGTGALDIVLPEEEAEAPPGEVPYHVAFVIDTWPAKNGKRVDGVPSTSAAIEAWFRGDENFRVLRAEDTTIGVLPARAIDVGLSAQAPEQYPDCGAPCVDTLSFEQLDDLGGIRGKDVYRYYFADISFGGETHLLSVEIQSRGLDHLDSLIPRVEAIFDTVRVPAHATPPIVGSWSRINLCKESLAAFKAAGLDDQIQTWVINNFVGEGASPPAGDECNGSIPPDRHSHFFTAAGRFGSLDATGKTVDDGAWVLVDADTLSFPEHATNLGDGTPVFVHFMVTGDSATFVVTVPASCSAPCRKAYGWAMSAFFGPTPWTRSK